MDRALGPRRIPSNGSPRRSLFQAARGTRGERVAPEAQDLHFLL